MKLQKFNIKIAKDGVKRSAFEILSRGMELHLIN